MATHDITLTVNGTEHEFTGKSRTLLVHTLCDHLHYTDTNTGCESTLYGACTVHMDGDAVEDAVDTINDDSAMTDGGDRE